MTRKLFSGGVLGIVLLIVGCNSKPPPVENKGSVCKTNVPKLYIVYISQMLFDPADLKLKAGDTVAFVNNDMVVHDITEETSKAWSSGQLSADSAWKFVVTKGADYYCSIHPTMKGKITIE